MKNILILFFVFVGISFRLSAQQKNEIQSLDIDQTDIIAALKANGIAIFKFETGHFDKKLNLTFILEAFSKDSLIESKLLYKGKNWFTTFDEKNSRIDKFVNPIRIIAKEIDNECVLFFDIEGFEFNRQFSVEKTYQRQFFKWIPYEDTCWRLNKKTPLLAYISSWKEESGYIRHCGVQKFSADKPDETNHYFSISPSYFVLSYIVEEIE